MQSPSPSLHLLADTDVNDPMHPRIQHALPLLQDLPEDWPTLRDMLESVVAAHNEELIPPARTCIHGERAGTLSSSVIALRDRSLSEARFHFADRSPCSKPYTDLSAQFSDRPS